MELDLVGCWDDFTLGEKFFEQGYAEVGDADGFDFTCEKLRVGVRDRIEMNRD